MRKIAAICFLLSISFQCLGREDSILGVRGNTLSWFNPTYNTDSLKDLLQNSEGTKRVDLLCELSNSFYSLTQDSIKYISLAREAMDVSSQIGYKNGLVKANFLLGRHFFRRDRNPQKARKFFEEADRNSDHTTHWSLRYRIWQYNSRVLNLLNLNDLANSYHQKTLETLDPNEAWLAHFLGHLDIMRFALLNNDHKGQMTHLESALEIYQGEKSKFELGDFNIRIDVEEIAIVLASKGEYRRAEKLMLDFLVWLSLPEMKCIQNDFFIAKINSRIGRIYSHWGILDFALDRFNKSYDGFLAFYSEYEKEIYDSRVWPSKRTYAINMANQLEERAVVLIKKGDLISAKNDLFESIEVRQRHNDLLGVAMCYDKLGEISILRGKYTDALNWFDLALAKKWQMVERASEGRGQDSALKIIFSSESIASTYTMIGLLYNGWEKYELAEEYINRSLDLCRKINSQKCEAEALVAIGDVYIARKQYTKSETTYLAAKNIYENIDNKLGLATIHEKFGDLYNEQRFFEKAKADYDTSRKLYETLELLPCLARLKHKQGVILAEQGDFKMAQSHFLESLETSERKGLRKTEMDTHLALSDIYQQKNDYEKSLIHFKKHQQLKDQLFTIELNRLVSEVEAQFKSNKDRQEILLLKHEKEIAEGNEIRNRFLVFLMIGVIIGSILIIFFYLRHNRLKTGHQLIKLQQQLLRSQMNPHFIFNSLGSIQNAIICEEPEKAIKYLSRFSKLIRNILDSSNAENVLLDKEINIIENYLYLQKLRFPDKFEYEVKVSPKIDLAFTRIPPMLAQPFIENSIQHGFQDPQKMGKLVVGFKPNGKTLLLEIEDNGIGREKANALKNQNNFDHKSMATNIAQDRIEVLNRLSKKSITLQIIDLYLENGIACGTKVVFKIPI